MLPDGVFIGLDFDEYLSVPDALGSSDKSRLWTRGCGWWWSSKHNSYRRPDAQSPEQLFGTALHAALLEGLHAYGARFCVKPSKADYPDALFTIPEIKAALRDAGIHPRGASGFVKEDWAEAAEIYLPGVDIWDNLMAEFERRHGGRDAISAEEDFAIRTMHALATEDRPENAEMRELLSVGSEFPILAELSIFYTDRQGLRHRARLDKMLPVATVDLKSVGEWRARPLAHSIDDHIKANGYDVQLADYHVARQEAFRMVLEDEGNLHGGTEEERTHFLAMAEWNQTHRWDWSWLFFQKPTTAGNAPILFPVRQPWGSGYHLSGFRKRQHALQTYKDGLARFGLDKPWGRVEPVHFTDEGHEYHITTSPFGWGPADPVDGEAEHFA